MHIGLTLKERCAQLKNRFDDFKISDCSLHGIYKKHGIKRKKVVAKKSADEDQ